MAEIAEAYVSLLPSARGFGSKLKSSIGGDIGKTGKSMGGVFSKAFGAAAAIGVGAAVGSFLKGSLGEAREAQKVGAQTAAVLKSTGGAANVSRSAVENLAAAISRKSGIDDEAIQSGQNLLLTFTNVRNEAGKGNKIFDQATNTLVDMSAALGTEPKQAAIQLGKALNDPIKGISALQRVGVSFTQGQKDQIKSLVESGRTMTAQKLILRELTKEFGGSAEAQATAGDKMRVAFGNIQEAVGTALLPLVDKVANAFVKLAPRIEGGAAKIGPLFSRITDAAGPLVDILGDIITRLGPVADRVGEFVRKNPTFVKAFAISLGVLAGAIGLVTLATTAFSIALNSTGIPIVIIAIAALVAGLVVAYQRSERFRNIVDTVAAAAKDFGQFLRDDVMPVLRDVASTIATKAQPVLKQLGETFKTDVLPAIEAVVAKFREWQPTIQRAIAVVLRIAAGVIKFGATVTSKVLPPLIRFVGFLISKAVPAGLRISSVLFRVVGALVRVGIAVFNAARRVVGFVRDAIAGFIRFTVFVASLPGRAASALGALVSKIGAMFSRAWDGAKNITKRGIDNIIDFVKQIPKKVGDLASKALSAGKRVGSGIISGLLAGLRSVGGFVSDLAGSIKSAINSALHLPVHITGPGPIPDFNIPAFARGVTNFRGGLALVGENGPEMVNLPARSDVYTAAETQRRLRAMTPNGSALVAGGGGFPRTMILEVGDRQFTAYVREVSDGSVGDHSSLAAQRSRALYAGQPA